MYAAVSLCNDVTNLFNSIYLKTTEVMSNLLEEKLCLIHVVFEH